jgi:hypothetical protein
MTPLSTEITAETITHLSSKEQKDTSRGIGVDMSSEAVTCRIEIVDELRDLAQELAVARRLGPINSVQPPLNTIHNS